MKGNIPGYPNYYISRDGKLFKLSTGKEIKVFYHKRYMRCKIYNGKTSKNIKIHRLVAEVYIPNPNNLPVVMHLNDDVTDNRVENLKWGTQKENVHDAINKGRLRIKGKDNPMYGVHRYGLDAPHISLNSRKIRRLNSMNFKGYRKEYIAYRLGVCRGTIQNYLINKHYKNILKEG